MTNSIGLYYNFDKTIITESYYVESSKQIILTQKNFLKIPIWEVKQIIRKYGISNSKIKCQKSILLKLSFPVVEQIDFENESELDDCKNLFKSYKNNNMLVFDNCDTTSKSGLYSIYLSLIGINFKNFQQKEITLLGTVEKIKKTRTNFRY